MDRFLKNIVLFLICIILINYIAYIFIAKPVLYDDYYPSINELNDYKCFLLSDSHGNAVEKNDLSEIGIFNFSFDSDSYTDMMLKLNFLINHTKPETIFLSADAHTLSPYRKQMNNKPRSIYFCDRFLYKQFYADNDMEYFFERYVKPYFPLLNTNNSKLFYTFLISLVKRNKLEKNEIPQFSNLSAAQKNTASINRRDYHFPEDAGLEISKKQLLKMISLCKENNITLLGVKFPLAQTYIEVLNGKSYGAETFLKAQGIRVIDLTTIFADKDYLFGDPDHLNKMGSKEFALQFAKKYRTNTIDPQCTPCLN